MKKPAYFFYGLILLGCLLSSTLFAISKANPYWPYILQQRKLAESLGVEIADYPASYAFPAGYFHEILQPGMTLNEVHTIVKGYINVYNCGYKEVYYYFSNNDNRAIRFEVIYKQVDDGEYLFLKLQTEDDNSRSIHVGNCKSGLIES